MTTWITPPTTGGERLDGTGLTLLTADRVLTGRRGDVPGTLEVVGEPGLPPAPGGPAAGRPLQADDASAPAPEQATGARGGQDRSGAAPSAGGAVLVEGRTIVAVGPVAELAARTDQQERAGRRVNRIHLPGTTLMPGLVETHAHLATSDTDVEYPDYGPHEVARLSLNAARAARELLSIGVTSVQNLGARHYVDVALREAIDNGDLRGPRVRASGPQITTTAGHSWHAGAEVDGLDGIRHEVRHHHKMGVDTVKVMATGGFMTGGSAPWFAQFTTEELTLLVAEAHRLGEWSAAHAHGTQGIERAVSAGVDYIAHASFISASGRTEFDPYLADRIAEAGIYVDATITPAMPAMLAADSSFAPPARLLWEHGVRIVTGHDSGIPSVPHRGYVGGLEALEVVGLPRTEVVLAATSRAAAAIGQAGVTGVLDAGFDADLIAVSGDPRQGLDALRHLELVVARGREYVPDAVAGLPAELVGDLGAVAAAEAGGVAEDTEDPARRNPIGPAATLAVWRTRSERAARHPEV